MTRNLVGHARPTNLPKDLVFRRPVRPASEPTRYRAVAPAMYPTCSACRAADETVKYTGLISPERLCAGCREEDQ